MNAALPEAVNPYQSPRELAAAPRSWRWRAFTPLVRWTVLAALIGPIVVVMLGVPAAGVGLWYALRGGDSVGCWLGSAAGVAVAIPLAYLWYNRVPILGNRWIERRLAVVWKSEGVDAAACGGRFVELATADEPRLYHEGSTNWDVGFLFLTSERLVYLGDCTSWSIAREQILGLRVGIGSFERLHPQHVFIRWQPKRGQEPEVLGLAPTDGPTLTACQASVPGLAEQIERWRKGELPRLAALPTALAMPPEPQLADVPGRPQGLQLAFTRCAAVVAGALAIGFIAVEVSQLTSGRLDVPHSVLAIVTGGSAMAAWLGAIAAWPMKLTGQATWESRGPAAN